LNTEIDIRHEGMGVPRYQRMDVQLFLATALFKQQQQQQQQQQLLDRLL